MLVSRSHAFDAHARCSAVADTALTMLLLATCAVLCVAELRSAVARPRHSTDTQTTAR